MDQALPPLFVRAGQRSYVDYCAEGGRSLGTRLTVPKAGQLTPMLGSPLKNEETQSHSAVYYRTCFYTRALARTRTRTNAHGRGRRRTDTDADARTRTQMHGRGLGRTRACRAWAGEHGVSVMVLDLRRRLSGSVSINRNGKAMGCCQARGDRPLSVAIHIAHGGVISLIMCPSFDHEIPLFKAHCPPYFSFGVGTYGQVSMPKD